MQLVHIETSGNQGFIFATNKLRENVGASELIWRIGAAAERAAPPGCRVIVATSGKASIICPDRAAAETVVREVTRRAAAEAPGLDVHGAIAPFDPTRELLDTALARVRDRRESLRHAIPSQATRFLRLPCLADCSTSGLPAAMPARDFHGVRGGDLRSAVSQGKWRAAEKGIERLAGDAGDVPVMRSVAELDGLRADDLDWLAVIHADGNGLGKLLAEFGAIAARHSPGGGWDAHADLLRRFSAGLDECARESFRDALAGAWERWRRHAGGRLRDRLPLVPLVLGGDDLTVICAGRFAVQLASDFLRAFERRTAEGIVGELSALRPGAARGGLSACAGIAVIKPHFPFHAAYELAADLLASAKQVKRLDRPCSAFDYHVLYDSSDASLPRIRAAWSLDDGSTSLTSRPYVVSEGFDDHPWAGPRTLRRLEARMRALVARDAEGRRLLPNSLLHDLRESLFLGRETAETRLKLVLGRHEPRNFGDLLADGRLFDADRDADGRATHRAALLDAMELEGFWFETA